MARGVGLHTVKWKLRPRPIGGLHSVGKLTTKDTKSTKAHKEVRVNTVFLFGS